MGVIGRLVWMNTCSKKQCRSLFWRMKAAMKKAVKKHTFLVALYGGPKKQFNFHYDPSSYALNFDDGTYHHHDHDHHHHQVVEHHEITKLPLPKQQESHLSTTWVYVVWVEYF
ncbi:hypothetical protein L1987_05348 [Smallanthus sonchifolius]|uniref:Uncharacterized protein n=1 Tax=Smallanthus sonchifolius TaxID=185202 RepID=A0ACB9JV62_9ASTR|nr:hypothetical protein L1987_05348 [Smallanthus sonchifolius]